MDNTGSVHELQKMSLAAKRIQQERIQFRKRRPFGFFANFTKKESGEQDIMRWHCGVKMPDDGPWKGATVEMHMTFSNDFPGRPPKVVLKQISNEVVFHPNIYPSGAVCLSILNEDKDWRPTLTVLTVLTGIRDLLGAPNPHSPAQEKALAVYQQDPDHTAWLKKVAEQAKKINDGVAYKPEDSAGK